MNIPTFISAAFHLRRQCLQPLQSRCTDSYLSKGLPKFVTIPPMVPAIPMWSLRRECFLRNLSTKKFSWTQCLKLRAVFLRPLPGFHLDFGWRMSHSCSLAWKSAFARFIVFKTAPSGHQAWVESPELSYSGRRPERGWNNRTWAFEIRWDWVHIRWLPPDQFPPL